MNESDSNAMPRPEISQVVEHLFRHEAGKIVATLTRIFGLEHLSLAEDVVQEALARALQTWPFYGVPDKPAAWIMRTARNLALDVVRREKVFRDKTPEIMRLMEYGSFSEGHEIADDRLRMMFVCCHPLLAPEDQTALALKTLCGFSVTEISRAFLTNDAAIAKRLTRAKQKIRDARIQFEIPVGEQLAQRLDGVLRSLYLLFNEGYKASTGEKLVREDVCAEAIRLTSLLIEHPAGSQPKAHALLALMLLNAARIPARVDDEGRLLRLAEQNRQLWRREMIARGMSHFAKSAVGDQITEYHLQAGIAACHCAARDYGSTDWRRILSLYDQLMTFDHSPIVALNRAVAFAEVHGPKAGIEVVNAIKNLESYYLFHAVLGEFELRLENFPDAATHYRRAIEMAELSSEKAFLENRLRDCEKMS